LLHVACIDGEVRELVRNALGWESETITNGAAALGTTRDEAGLDWLGVVDRAKVLVFRRAATDRWARFVELRASAGRRLVE
jgi:hypothetical protein